MTSVESTAAINPPSSESKDTNPDEMVAAIFSAAHTPPHSPLRVNGARQSLSVSNQNVAPTVQSNTDKNSPKGRRASSYHPDTQATPLSASRRTSLLAESPSRSPVPLGNRLQPATAAAPVVGRHKKNNSLVGFDPLLSDAVFSNTAKVEESLDKLKNKHQSAPATPTRNKKDSAEAPALSKLSLSPPKSPPKAGDAKDAPLSQELRQLAKDLSAASPVRPSSTKVSKPKFGRATSLTPKFNLTPPFRGHDKVSLPPAPDVTKEPLSAPHRKMPWQRHRRTKSMETPSAVAEAVKQSDSFENDSSKANGGTFTSSMMKDLYDCYQQEDRTSLALPNLYKPAPTSFLTGNDVVRSSEQDPSPFQMEIPSLDQTLVAARSVQFVDIYRKEDMNFDMQALVGLPRMTMRSFVENADSHAPNSQLNDAHRPIVESLLEAADDITVAGFFATENAGSADARREAIVLERQMQVMVVYRGTTQEQTGKTAIFKKKDKQQSTLEALSADNEDCKAYASVKQAHMDLEQKVFECLDRFMDQNPFCDVVFTGSSFGGAMATLGAFRYAIYRPVVRVSCQTFGSPKAGNVAFRQQANSLPNLKVIRIEYANDQKCMVPQDNQGAHVGHSILLSKNNEGNNKGLSAVACRFGNHDARKGHASKSSSLLATFNKKERDISSYVSHLEQLNQSKANKWVKDFAGEDGAGVFGKDNEQRQVV